MLVGQSHVDHGQPERVINIEPHPEITEKKKELLHQIALERLAVKEAKGMKVTI